MLGPEHRNTAAMSEKSNQDKLGEKRPGEDSLQHSSSASQQPSGLDGSLQPVPYHVFSPRTKTFLVVAVSIAATLSGLSSNIFFPAIRDIADHFHTDPRIINVSITTYLIAQGLAPSLWSPLADHFGRRIILIATLSVYLLANIALALSPNVGVLLAFRALQAVGSSSTISLGAGVIADLVDASERGAYLGVFSGARQSSIALGPVLGGILTQFLGWRSIFWFLVVLSGLCVVAIIAFLPETLRRIAGNGSTLSTQTKHRALLHGWLNFTKPDYVQSRFPNQAAAIIDESNQQQRHATRFRASLLLQPLFILVEKDVACALFFGSCTYTAWSMLTATTTVLLKTAYGFNTLQIGLCFLANGLGCVAGSLLSGRALNETFRREQDVWNLYNGKQPSTPVPHPLPAKFPIEKVRLVDAPLHSTVMVIGFLIFGWSLTPPSVPGQIDLVPTAGHWITPLLALFMVGYSNTAILNSNSALIVDLFPGKSASASAVVNLSRNLTAALGVALVDYIEDYTSPGWLGVVLAGLVLVGVISLLIHGQWGMGWREMREQRLSENRGSEMGV